MSRIGNKVLDIPAGVTVSVSGNVATVKGPKGSLELKIPAGITVDIKAPHIHVLRSDDAQQNRENHGTTRALLHNAIVGVSTGFSKKLELVGIGFKATMRGSDVVLDIGYSHEVVVHPVLNSKISVLNPTTVVVEGIDRQAVGQTAAVIRAHREPEPYLGKGIKYSDEVVLRKEGKRAGKK